MSGCVIWGLLDRCTILKYILLHILVNWKKQNPKNKNKNEFGWEFTANPHISYGNFSFYNFILVSLFFYKILNG